MTLGAMNNDDYVHGRDAAESTRLQDQAGTLAELLHADTHYPAGSRVLEVGCGVGAQTLLLAERSPGARFTCIDVSAEHLALAQQRAEAAHLTPRVSFVQADLHDAPFDDQAFDHVFVCFVLEHLHDPERALRSIARLLRPGGSLTVIEGDHGSTLMHPQDPAARDAIDCLVALQRRAGGDALIGRRLYPLIASAGFGNVNSSPRVVMADASRPAMVDGFTRKTFTAMVAGVRGRALEAGLTTEARFDAGIRGLLRTTEDDGAFIYTFFKSTATRCQ